MRVQDGFSSREETGFPSHGDFPALLCFSRISPLSLSPLAVNSGAGQSH